MVQNKQLWKINKVDYDIINSFKRNEIYFYRILYRK